MAIIMVIGVLLGTTTLATDNEAWACKARTAQGDRWAVVAELYNEPDCISMCPDLARDAGFSQWKCVCNAGACMEE